MSPAARIALTLLAFAAVGALALALIELLKAPDHRSYRTAAILGALIGGALGIWFTGRKATPRGHASDR